MDLFNRPRAGIAAVAAALGVWLLAAPDVRADNLDDRLLAQTSTLFKFLESKNARVIGVLKFQAKKGDDAKSFNVGPINSIMAERLESVLIMGSALKQNFSIIRDASGHAAAQKQQLTYLSAEGRKKLLDLEYPLWVGEKSAKADLFLTGFVGIDPRSHKVSVVLAYFDKSTEKVTAIKDPKNPENALTIEVPTDRALLADAGQSFVLSKRSMTKRSTDDDLFADEDAQQRKEGKKENVITEVKERLVEMKMFINGEEVKFEADPTNVGDGRFTSRDPKQGDKVYFTVTNKSNERVAVVVKINGLNTLYEQTDEAKLCNKWVLDPGDKTLTVDGFYVNDSGKENKRPFNVRPDDDSAAEALANSQAGTVSLHVFIEGSGEGEHRDEGVKTRGLSKGKYASVKRDINSNTEAAQQLMDNQSKTRKKGLIAPSLTPEDGSKLKSVEFKDPQEKETIILRYYKPGSRGGL